jgi:phenylacetate-CoA ligase
MAPRDRPFWDRDAETIARRDLEALQYQRLRDLVERTWAANADLKTFWSRSGFSPDRLRSLDDLRRIPLIDKHIIHERPPSILQQQLPWERIRAIHAATSSSTDIIPVTVTEKDLADWGERNARSLWMVGVRPGDLLMNSFRFGLSTGGFGFHEGARRLGACNVDVGPGQTDLKVSLVTEFPVSVLVMMPSYGLYLAARLAESGVDMARTSLRLGLFGAEPYTPEIRDAIEKGLGITAYNEYGMNELLGPGVACECPERAGLHIWADHFLVECIDPESGEAVSDGEEGELVFTWLTSEGMAIVRYRSHDRATLTREPCACGRTHPRMGWVSGRTDEALSVGGYVVYPGRVEQILSWFPDITRFRMVLTHRNELDRLVIEAETPYPYESDAAKQLASGIAHLLRSQLGVTAEIVTLPPGSLEGQIQRCAVLDHRSRTGKYHL